MHLRVNGEPVATNATTLQELLLEHGSDVTAVATAVNGIFVPMAQRTETLLSEGMEIDIVAPMQGG
jgi:sulfur carrier protein